MPDEVRDGNELIDEIAKVPNLDFFFDANPKSFTEDQFRELIEVQRRERALFIEKKSSK